MQRLSNFTVVKTMWPQRCVVGKIIHCTSFSWVTALPVASCHLTLRSYCLVPKANVLKNQLEFNHQIPGVIRPKISQFGALKTALLELGPSKHINVDLSAWSCWIETAFEGVCQGIVYAGVIHGPFELSFHQNQRKVVIVFKANLDPHGLNIDRVSNAVPHFARNWTKTIDVNLLKRSLSTTKWDEVKQWFLQRSRSTILCSSEWQFMEYNIIDQLQCSHRLCLSVLTQLRKLPDARDLDFSWKYSTLICLEYLRNFVQDYSVDCKNENLCNDMLQASMLVEQKQRMTDQDALRHTLRKVSDNVHCWITHHDVLGGAKAVDEHLATWQHQSDFSNNFSPAEGEQESQATSFDQQSIEIPSCSIADHLRAYCSGALKTEEMERVVSIQQEFGHPIDKILPDNILLITKYGSQMYNLATENSDVDYFVIFRRRKKFSCQVMCNERLEGKSRIPATEYQLIEVRLFCQMLFQTSSIMCELLLAQNTPRYIHPLMQVLFDNWQIIMCERVKNCFKNYALDMLGRLKPKEFSSFDRALNMKLLYQIFHKIMLVEDMSKGMKPQVIMTGEKRDFLLSIRDGSFLQNSSVLEVKSMAQRRLEKANADKTGNLPMYVDHNSLVAWLTCVRNHVL